MTGNEQNHRRSSKILSDLNQVSETQSQLTYGEILDTLGRRAFGLALLFFALPSALPISSIPGVSFIFSIPIAVFAMQLAFASPTVWLPKTLKNKSISSKTLQKIISTARPKLEMVEKFLKPRIFIMTTRWMGILNGLMLFVLAIFLMLPIPFSNFILAGIIILFCLGLTEKDGLFILLGYGFALVYFAFISTVVLALTKAIIKFFTH